MLYMCRSVVVLILMEGLLIIRLFVDYLFCTDMNIYIIN